MALSNPRDLFLHDLAELLWIERTLEFEVLPALCAEVADDELRAAIAAHLGETREHVARAERAFLAARAEPAAAASGTLAAAKAQHERGAGEAKEPVLRDLVHAQSAARTEHLELAVYDALIGLAQQLGLSESATLLEQSRREEEEALRTLEKLAGALRGRLGGG
jgi:ferritin-like metal-binding protein YciE